ncbi:hypothetical protein QTP86_022126, partial [Hemibagrus guttatus]
MNYKTTSPACDSDASLSDVLNDFYDLFEMQNNAATRKTIPPPNDQWIYSLTFSTFPELRHCSYVPQDSDHCPHAEEVRGYPALVIILPSHSHHHDEVLRGARHAAHLDPATTLTGPPVV